MTTTKQIHAGDVVLPGDRLGVIEEFIPGVGTFDDNGVIFATIQGKIEIDMKKREITVISETQPPMGLVNGDIVLARVVSVKAKIALVDIFHSERKDYPIPFAGIIQIRNISREYVNSIDDQLVQDDWVRAKVVDASSIPVQLATDESYLGVIRAHCRFCAGKMTLVGARLICSNPECNRPGRRKIAKDYLNPKTMAEIRSLEEKTSVKPPVKSSGPPPLMDEE